MKSKIKEIIKSKYLIVSCILFLTGVTIGVCVLNFLPETLKNQLGAFELVTSKNLFYSAMNKFTLPISVLILLYLGGFNAMGHITITTALLGFGTVFGIKKALNYHYLGSDFIINSVAEYFTFSVYSVFLVLTMAESSFFSAQTAYRQMHSSICEKPLYNAKNQSVKLIAFTAIVIVFSALSTYILSVI